MTEKTLREAAGAILDAWDESTVTRNIVGVRGEHEHAMLQKAMADLRAAWEKEV